jgi:hypothetical protein
MLDCSSSCAALQLSNLVLSSHCAQWIANPPPPPPSDSPEYAYYRSVKGSNGQAVIGYIKKWASVAGYTGKYPLDAVGNPTEESLRHYQGLPCLLGQ